MICAGKCGAAFDVTVAERTMSKWLRTLGFTRLQPRPYHRQRDEAAQETFKTYGPPPLKGLSEISCMGSGEDEKAPTNGTSQTALNSGCAS